MRPLWTPKPTYGLGGVKAAVARGSGSGQGKEIDEAARKAVRLDQGERVNYADALVSEIGRSLTSHRRHTMTGDFLRTALRDAQALVGVLSVAVDHLGTPIDVITPNSSLGVSSVRQG